jgi:hypothetical protein
MEAEDPAIPRDIIERRKTCKGHAIKLVAQKVGENFEGKKCYSCSSVTHYWCTGCHHFFCNAAKKGGNIKDRKIEYAYFETGVPGKIACTQIFCFQQEHPSSFISNGHEKMPIP